MLRTDLEADLRERRTEDGFLFPAYEDYCFSNVPDTVGRVLAPDGGQDRDRTDSDARRPLPDDVFGGRRDETADVDRVVVFLIDGFGFEGWKRLTATNPLLERVTERGTVTPLTSIYPSETAAAITTFHTGTQPAEHGVIGWNVYEPSVDTEFEVLPFRTKDGEEPPLDRADVSECEPIYPDLREKGVDCRHVVPFETTEDGATCHTYDTEDLTSFVGSVGEAARAARTPSYLYGYLPHIDHASHEHGTRSETHAKTVAEVCEALERALDVLEESTEEDERTLVVFTADHGHVDTDPERNVDLESIDAVTDNLARRANGDPIRFAGSPRNVHLHLRDGTVSTVADELGTLDARVFSRETALDRGLFGDRVPGEAIRRRVGDLVCTHRDLGLWYGAESDELELIGMHGGLHPDEMLVPFAAVDLEATRE
ncbi:alkaline phosphatase family protein [Halomontanus rarus]|uniref:alkaline phosphatase family protein n=1 Tax=Halomontanus rarus TaxID=3034020 RepID=UPI0023E886F8|nr:nucleotide pyrophosphatase/phosphodiesterase family protein [Halovivax sp. TS33]